MENTRQIAADARRAGDAARDQGDWVNALDHYKRALKYGSPDQGIIVQYGNMLKEDRQLDAAIGAYKQAIALDGSNADVSLQLGHAYKLAGQKLEAIEAYAQALGLDAELTSARDELIALGARDRLPSNVTGRSAATLNLAQLHQLLERGIEAAGTLNSLSTYPIENYDLFRRHFPIQPPPASTDQTPILVLVEAVGAPAFALRETMRSLQDQRHTLWQAHVRTSGELAAHPVASMALEDARIHFNHDIAEIELDKHAVVVLDAGTVLDREAIGWLHYAGLRTGSDLVYADHDTYEPHWQHGSLRRDPVLLPMFDPDDMADIRWTPAVVMAKPTLAADVRRLWRQFRGERFRWSLLTTPLPDVTRAHLPRLLSSRNHSLLHDIEAPEERRPPTAKRRILVVIPTRDEPDMLNTCVDSLRAKADHPERLDIIVVSNRSRPDSRSRFEALESSGAVTVLDVDEPFNWSRINNLAVRAARSAKLANDILVFANNDIVAKSQGWDCELDALFADPSVGVVGARLLYPDGTVQHGGVLLGGHMNRPVHDGLRSPAHQAGPLERLQRQRGVAAVTGAFMAVSPALFDQVDGFDPNLAVAYNDVDFCLKARSAGYRVVYAPRLELIHHESVTRGTNLTADKIAWDDSELASLYERWGDWLKFDPTRNPQWTSSHDQPFEGFIDLTLSGTLDSLDLSARPRPWRIDLDPAAKNQI